MYGINDLSDEDTDAHNDNKGTKEHLLKEDHEQVVTLSVMIGAFVGLLLGMVSGNGLILFLILLFLFLGYAYSGWPFRFKARPFVDFLSNFLYVIPGLVGYAQFYEEMPSLYVILGLWTWVMAMHLFSAIPDIESDRKVKLKTSAVVFGRNATLVLCLVLWSIAAYVFSTSAFNYQPWIYLSFVYPSFAFVVLIMRNEKVAYWWFPKINGLIGFGFFLILFFDLIIFK